MANLLVLAKYYKPVGIINEIRNVKWIQDLV